MMETIDAVNFLFPKLSVKSEWYAALLLVGICCVMWPYILFVEVVGNLLYRHGW